MLSLFVQKSLKSIVMTKGIGIDIVDVIRMEKRILKSSFVQLVFSEKEITYCQSKKHKAQHYAGRFAVKEAYMKAIGLGWTKEANFKDIEVVNNENGKPEILLSNDTLAYFKDQNFERLLVSISHTTTVATAIVTIE